MGWFKKFFGDGSEDNFTQGADTDLATFSASAMMMIFMQTKFTPYSDKHSMRADKEIERTGRSSGGCEGVLPKDKFVYGYICGFMDSMFQRSKWQDVDVCMSETFDTFVSFYGAKDAKKIFVELPMTDTRLLEDPKHKKFKKGLKLGGQEALEYWTQKKSVPYVLTDYLNDKYKKNKKK